MTIEQNVFKRAIVDFSKLEPYGFKKVARNYCYEQVFMNGDFKATVKIDSCGKVWGEVYDLAGDDVYLPLRVEEMSAGYVGEVRIAYEAILQDIKENCCKENYFAGAQANRITTEIRQRYGDEPDFPWGKFDNYGVFRNPDTLKWYALIMTVDRSKLEAEQCGNVEIMNIKLDANKILELQAKKGFYPAYHMNKKSWITLMLDDLISDAEILQYLDESHSFTHGKSRGSASKKSIKGG